MAKGITTSIRLTPELRQQLEYLSHTLHRGKNWVITQALQEFINSKNHDFLAAEAHKQSLLASHVKANDKDEEWIEAADLTGWEE